MDELNLLTEAANGGIMLRSGNDEDDKKTPGYIYYYYTNNCTLTGEITTDTYSLLHSKGGTVIVSSKYQSDGGDTFVCTGSRYDKSNDITVCSTGRLCISSGGTANNTIVNAYDNSLLYLSRERHPGVMVFAGGTANGVTVNFGGQLSISSGGTALAIKENGGQVRVNSNATATFLANTLNGLILSNTGGRQSLTTTLHSGTTAFNTSIMGRVVLDVCGGMAYNTTINTGTLSVSNGGVATDSIMSWGSATVASNGTVIRFTILSAGVFSISNGGVATSSIIGGYGIAGSVVDSYGGSMYVYSGGIADNTKVVTDGWIYICDGGIADYTVLAGGYSYVLSGGIANNTVAIRNGGLSVASGGTASILFSPFGVPFVHSDAGATVIYLDRDKDVYYGGFISGILSSADTMTGLDIDSGNSAIVYESGVLEDANVNSGGIVLVSSGGTAKDVSVAHGGSALISSGGRIEQSFEINGQMTVDNGGIARIWSASTVAGESASLVNGGTIEFLVASAAASGEALLNDYTKIEGYGGYAITVNGDQSSGQYRLIGNAAAFNKNITITVENTEFSGTFQWNGSAYNTVTLDDRAYTLNIDENNDLVLGVGMNPTRVDYEFTEIGQTVYYKGEKPEGCTLEGVLKVIPYTADITLSFDKNLAEGLYEFTTSVAEVKGSVNHFTIAVSNGFTGSDGEPAPKSVSYISDNMCYNGTLVSETDSTVTYKFTGVNDYLLIDSIPSDTMQLDVVCGTNDATVSKSKNGSFSFIHGSGLTDMNKDLCLKLINIHGATNKGESISIEVYTAGTQQNQIKNDEKNQYVLIPFVTIDGERYQDLEYELEMFEKGKRFRLCIDEKENTNNNPVFNITIDGTVDENSDVSVSQAVYNDDTITIETQNGVAGSAPRDAGYCWVATAVNMMYEAGYLDVSEKDLDKVYTIIRDNYYIRDGNQSLGADVTRVFNDYLYKKLNINTHQQGICKSFWGDAITQALQDIMSSENHTVVGGLSVSGMWDTRNINHVFTCYDVRLTMAGETLGGSVDCADSDIGFFSSLLNTWSIYYDHGIFQKNRWKMNYQNKGYITITDIVTLISNSSRNKDGKLVQLSLKDINSYKEVIISRDNYVQENTRIIYALEYEGLSDGSVSGYIFDSVIPKGSRLRVVSGAYAEEMIIHEAGSVEFDSGSIAKGTIRTTGGTLTVESGVDVSEAEFDFAVSRMENGNSSPLLNSLSNVSGSNLTITIVNGQSAGKYVLAGGASDFKGVLSVVGEYDYTQDVGEGFDNGLIGELGLENSLNIEDKTYSLSVEDDTLILTIKKDEAIATAPVNLVGTADRVSWEYPAGADLYEVNLSTDDFGQVFRWLTDTTAQDLYELPGGTYQWRVMVLDNGEDWAVGEDFVSENDPGTPKVVRSNADGVDDIFFASANGSWSREYFAQHAGSLDEEGWTGTGEFVSANGKGRIQNLFFGSSDPSVLCLTDGENGDAIFLDDAYTELPEELEANTARLLRIREIRAGAGDDIIDMTSQRFEYVGDGQTLCGGDGNDVLWANKGANWLFGDLGNDRLVGASGDDLIVGGIGDDRLHGGGGDDFFTFCENWGKDTVEQLAGGNVTLWFESGSIDNWDEATLTYSDGDNCVKVSGVTAEQVTLKFGAGATPDDADQFASLSNMGAFEAFTTRKIFEEATLA